MEEVNRNDIEEFTMNDMEEIDRNDIEEFTMNDMKEIARNDKEGSIQNEEVIGKLRIIFYLCTLFLG